MGGFASSGILEVHGEHHVTVAMLEPAGVGAHDHVIDLGPGDGRIVVTAAKRFGASGPGVEIVPELVAQSRDHARRAGHGRGRPLARRRRQRGRACRRTVAPRRRAGAQACGRTRQSAGTAAAARTTPARGRKVITRRTTLDGVGRVSLRLDLIPGGFHDGRSTRQLRPSFEDGMHDAMGGDGARCIANARGD